jgi:hypothetical protein
VAYSVEREANIRKEEEWARTCRNEKFGKDTEEPVAIGGADYGLLKGDIFLTFRCENKTAKIREEAVCYKDVPIQPSGFVNPLTRQYALHSTQVLCSRTFPLTIRANEGWIQILPHLKIRPDPLEKAPDGIVVPSHKDFSHGGLYSDQELADWVHEVSFPSYHQALLKAISYGSCVDDGSCSTQNQVEGITPYDLSKLIPEIESKLNLWGRLKEWLHVYGDFLALLCLIIIGFKLVSDIIMIALTMMKAGPAAAAALICSLYLYNRQTYRRLMRKHEEMRRGEGGHQELQPLASAPTPKV